jgi:hypothetical protein
MPLCEIGSLKHASRDDEAADRRTCLIARSDVCSVRDVILMGSLLPEPKIRSVFSNTPWLR